MRRRWGALAAALVAGCATSAPMDARQRGEAVLRAGAVTTGQLILTCSPADAEVMVDEVSRGVCSDFGPGTGGLGLGAGVHKLVVGKAGYWPQTNYVETSGASVLLSFTLQPESSSG